MAPQHHRPGLCLAHEWDPDQRRGLPRHRRPAVANTVIGEPYPGRPLSRVLSLVSFSYTLSRDTTACPGGGFPPACSELLFMKHPGQILRRFDAPMLSA